MKARIKAALKWFGRFWRKQEETRTIVIGPSKLTIDGKELGDVKSFTIVLKKDSEK